MTSDPLPQATSIPLLSAEIICPGFALFFFASAEAKKNNAKPGHIISADKRGIEVACGKGSLVIHELQRPGKNRISAAEFCDQVYSANKPLLSL